MRARVLVGVVLVASSLAACGSTDRNLAAINVAVDKIQLGSVGDVVYDYSNSDLGGAIRVIYLHATGDLADVRERATAALDAAGYRSRPLSLKDEPANILAADSWSPSGVDCNTVYFAADDAPEEAGEVPAGSIVVRLRCDR